MEVHFLTEGGKSMLLQPWQKKPNDLHQITINGTLVNVKIVKTETIENSTGIQYVVTYNIPGYGIAQPFYYDANTNYVKERKINSGIPKEFAYKFGKNFNWSYYFGY